MAFDDWTYEKTVSEPITIRIKYFDREAGEEKEAELISTNWSEVTTTYEAFVYEVVVERTLLGEPDENGNQPYQVVQEVVTKSEDIVSRRDSFTRSTIAAVNGAFVKWNLEILDELPQGDANRKSVTTYRYLAPKNADDTPRLVQEITREYISEFEFAGSLNIQDYERYKPSTAMIHVSTTITKYKEYRGRRDYTQTSTTRYLALGLTQEGQQSAAKQLETATLLDVKDIVESMMELVCDGTEVRSTIGRLNVPSRPSGDELLKDYLDELQNGDNLEDSLLDEVTDPDDPDDFDGVFVTFGPGEFAANDGNGFKGNDGDGTSGDGADDSTTVTVGFPATTGFTPDDGFFSSGSSSTYPLPFPPGPIITVDEDDYKVTIKDSNSTQAAKRYAEMINALKAGNAYGFNITTSADKLPSPPFAPLYINAAGLSVAMRLNGTSWAFDQSGLVVSSDLLLCGIAGKIGPVTSSWVRVPVSLENLPVLSPPTTNPTPAPGSTIEAPEDFDPLAPGDIFSLLPKNNNDTPGAIQDVDRVIGPFLLAEQWVARSRHRTAMVEYPYQVSVEAEDVEIRSRHLGTADVGMLLAMPAVEAVIAPQLPAISTGAAAAVPATLLNPEAIVPSLSTGAAVPAGVVDATITALAPELRSGVGLAVPTVEATITALVLDTVGPEGPRLEIPTVEAAITAEDPAVVSGVGLAMPAVTIEATTPIPVAVSGVALAVPAVEATIAAQVPSVVITVPPLFKAVTYTGNGGTLSVTGLGFKPGIVWVKARNAFTAHTLFDAARGPTKYWQPSGDAAEITDATTLTSFDSDGFTVGASSLVNTNGTEYIAWCWRDPGAAATNTQGTITSTVAASPAQGISLISYAGAASAGTVGHGLGIKPEFLMVKNNGLAAFGVVGSSLMDQYRFLTVARHWSEIISSGFQGFTDTTFAVGSNMQNVNILNSNFTAYAFGTIPGASKIGVYSGSGGTDKPITLDFQPQFVLIRAYSTTGNWMLFDTARGQSKLLTQSIVTESTVSMLTMDSGGFTVKANADTNYAGVNYLYVAFA